MIECFRGVGYTVLKLARERVVMAGGVVLLAGQFRARFIRLAAG